MSWDIMMVKTNGLSRTRKREEKWRINYVFDEKSKKEKPFWARERKETLIKYNSIPKKHKFT